MEDSVQWTMEVWTGYEHSNTAWQQSVTICDSNYDPQAVKHFHTELCEASR